jgi:hypothetical protein
MDQSALVEMQWEEGEALIRRLIGEGIHVSQACWVKEAEEGGVYLYIATSLVDEQGLPAAYRRLHPILRQELKWVDPFEIKLISPNHPVAEAVETLHKKYPGVTPTRFGGAQFGGMSVDWVIIYPPVTKALRGP